MVDGRVDGWMDGWEEAEELLPPTWGNNSGTSTVSKPLNSESSCAVIRPFIYLRINTVEL